MIKLPENKLWALPSVAEAIETAAEYEHAYSCMDHILVVSPKKPLGAKEVTDEYIHLLTKEDWAWLMLTSERIRREQENEFHDELAKMQDEFIRKFTDGLEQLRKEEKDGGENAEK